MRFTIREVEELEECLDSGVSIWKKEGDEFVKFDFDCWCYEGPIRLIYDKFDKETRWPDTDLYRLVIFQLSKLLFKVLFNLFATSNLEARSIVCMKINYIFIHTIFVCIMSRCATLYGFLHTI